MQDFRKLLVWQRGEALALEVTALFTTARCRAVPGLRSQIIRAAGAIPDLLAEGCGKQSSSELAHYVDIALGSSSELRGQLHRAMRAGVLDTRTGEDLDERVDELRRMLYGLGKAIKNRPIRR